MLKSSLQQGPGCFLAHLYVYLNNLLIASIAKAILQQ